MIFHCFLILSAIPLSCRVSLDEIGPRKGSDNDEIPHYPSNYAPSSIISVATGWSNGDDGGI